MPTCPRCGKDIDILINVQLAEKSYETSLDEGKKLRYQLLDNYTEIKEEEFRCSECGTTLFKTELEAIAFLRA